MAPRSLLRHGLLLCICCGVIVCVWMLPIVLAGFPFVLTTAVRNAHVFVQTGVLEDSLNPLFRLLIQALLHALDWQDPTAWAAASAITMGLALIPLWWSVRLVWDARLAWATVPIFAFLPMHWREAVSTGYYPLALLLLFTGFVLFLKVRSRSRAVAAACLGLCYGLVIATTHAFFPLLPWFVCVYLWAERKRWPAAMAELALCGLCAYLGFIAPTLPDALRPGLTLPQRAAVLLPVEENLMQPAELYGDAYAAEFLRDEFDARLREQARSDSFIERRSNENFRINQGVERAGLLRAVASGTWLFGNALAGLAMQDVMGGVFLWLFIIPGVVVLYRRNTFVCLSLLGTWLSMEVILRFVFRYARIHLMDVGWVWAVIAGAGVLAIADAVQRTDRRWRASTVATGLLLVITLQLAQASRTLFAREYAVGRIPKAQAVADAVASLPSDAIIAQPKDDDLFLLTEHTSIVLHVDTIDVLAASSRLAQPIQHYGITHVLGYDEERTRQLLSAVPGLRAVRIPPASAMPLTAWKRYLLNLVR